MIVLVEQNWLKSLKKKKKRSMPMTNKFHHSMWPEQRWQRLQESPRDWASPFVNKPSPLLRPPLPLLQVLTFLPCPLGLNPHHYQWQPGCRSDARHLKKRREGRPGLPTSGPVQFLSDPRTWWDVQAPRYWSRMRLLRLSSGLLHSLSPWGGTHYSLRQHGGGGPPKPFFRRARAPTVCVCV